MRMIDLILKKRNGQTLNFEELNFIANGAAKLNIPDYQLSSWLMAVFFNGLIPQEMADFTKAMAKSGKRLDLKNISGLKIDKHSTGGVGDGPSLAIAPIVASCNVIVPMMSGRGLGHTGGTLDKLESIENFQVRLDISHILKQLKEIKVCLFGQTNELAPSDKKLYSLRDVTGTVESIPLIVASILSKKYAEGINGLVMDVKFGSGAFMKEYSKSRELAENLIKTAKLLNIKASAFLTDMNNPLGRAIGNGIEMEQAIRFLQNEKISDDYENLTYALSGYMIYMGKKARTYEEGKEKAIKSVKEGLAIKKLKEIIKWQKGNEKVVENPSLLKRAKFKTEIKSLNSSYISEMNARIVGNCSLILGVGRNKAEDNVDFGAGIWLNKKVGDKVKKGETIAYMYASEEKKLIDAKKIFLSSIKYSNSKPKIAPIIREILS